MPGHQILALSCRDQPGITARVAGCLYENGGNIVDAQQFNSQDQAAFFMRVEFDPRGAEPAVFAAAFKPLAESLAMQWSLRARGQPRKAVLMVSKFDHCLADLLYRHRIDELPMQIVAVVSNHPQSALSMPLPQDIPFYHLPVTPESKPAQEARLRELINSSGAELVVLARYMQVLSDGMTRFLAGRCINIHHSFLPGFKGARPYHQAHDRGVKMIGATAHYVTANLDEGPIIHQDVESISHGDTPEELVRKGRDIERRVLAEAVRLHLDDRVFISGNRTVVFRD